MTSQPRADQALQIVAQANAYFARHYPEPIDMLALARQLGISEPRLSSCFDHCRGKTPFQALQTYRLSQLYRAITEQPEQPLQALVQACGLPELPHTNALFEEVFGISLASFRHTSGRAQDDRRFRAHHPEEGALLVGARL